MSLHSTVGAPPQGNEKLPSTGSLSSTAPVVSQLLFSFGTRPGLALAVEGRSVSDLLFRDIRVEAFKLWVVSQHLPWDREVMLGFKWSSQHLERGGCDGHGHSEAAFGSVRARRVALAWSALCCAA